MKLNKLSLVFTLICSLVPSLTLAFPALLKAIVRMETFVGPKGEVRYLLSDDHNVKCPGQEKEIIKGCAENNIAVCVEDALACTEHKKDKKFEDTLLGLTYRLEQAGVQATSVEPRLGFWGIADNKVPDKEFNKRVVVDYKTLIEKLKKILPNDKLGAITRDIIKQSQEREEPLLADIEQGKIPEKGLSTIGRDALDALVLAAFSQPNAPTTMAFVGGPGHCGGVAAVLKKVDFKRVKCVETGNKRPIARPYAALLTADNAHLYTEPVDGISEVEGYFPGKADKPLTPEQIKEYFA